LLWINFGQLRITLKLRASATYEILDPIRSQLGARRQGSTVVKQLGSDIHGRLINQGVAALCGQQRFNFPPQGGVGAASCGNESGPRFRPMLQRLVVDLLDATPFFPAKTCVFHIHALQPFSRVYASAIPPRSWPPAPLLPKNTLQSGKRF
jgi:hypothetical protein